MLVLDPSMTQAPPRPNTFGMSWLVIFAVLVLVTFAVRRWRRARARARGWSDWGIGGASGLGNALQELNSTLMPNHPTVEVLEQIDEEREEGGQGDGRDPDAPVP